MRKFGVHYSCVTGTVYIQFTNMAADRWLEDRALYGRYNCTSYQLMIGKKSNYKKLYTVLSYLGVFTFCTCCILICLACIVASFKLSCV